MNGREYRFRFIAGTAETRVPAEIGGLVEARDLSEPEVVALASDLGWKRIYAGPHRAEGRVARIAAEVKAVLVSPFENRAAVIYATQYMGDQFGFDLTVIGSHLTVGFQAGTPRTGVDRTMGIRIWSGTVAQ